MIACVLNKPSFHARKLMSDTLTKHLAPISHHVILHSKNQTPTRRVDVSIKDITNSCSPQNTVLRVQDQIHSTQIIETLLKKHASFEDV